MCVYVCVNVCEARSEGQTDILNYQGLSPKQNVLSCKVC